MSLFKRFTEQNGVVVARDEKNNVVAKASPLPTAPLAKNGKVESWRSQMRRVTNGGMDALLHIANVARGNPVRSVRPDTGEYTDWEVPTIAEQMDASKWLAEFMLGKAVAQTEVMRAEEEASDHAQYAAMSDEALAEAARPWLERVEKKSPPLPEGKSDHPDDSPSDGR